MSTFSLRGTVSIAAWINYVLLVGIRATGTLDEPQVLFFALLRLVGDPGDHFVAVWCIKTRPFMLSAFASYIKLANI